MFLKRCLQKDPKQRIGDIHDVRSPWMAHSIHPRLLPFQWSSPRRRGRGGGARCRAAAAVIAASAITGATIWLARPKEPVRGVSRFVVPFGEGLERTLVQSQGLAISPDFTTIAYVASDQIYVRPIGALEARLLTRTGAATAGTGPRQPAFSPDGRSIAYAESESSKNAIKRIEVTGGAAVTVAADVTDGAYLEWRGDSILFGTLRLLIDARPAFARWAGSKVTRSR